MGSVDFRVGKEQRENRDTKERRERGGSVAHLELRETEALKVPLAQEEIVDFRVCSVHLVITDLKAPWVEKVKGDFLGHLESKGKLGSAFRDPRVTSGTRGKRDNLVLRDLASLDHRGLKGHRESKEREDRWEKVSLEQRESEAWRGRGGSEDSRALESKETRGILAVQVFPGPSASQEQEYRARRAWRDQGGHRVAEAHKERAFLDPRGTKVCRARLAPQEREGLETLELRVSQDQRGCLVCLVCQGRTERLDRRVSQDL